MTSTGPSSTAPVGKQGPINPSMGQNNNVYPASGMSTFYSGGGRRTSSSSSTASSSPNVQTRSGSGTLTYRSSPGGVTERTGCVTERTIVSRSTSNASTRSSVSDRSSVSGVSSRGDVVVSSSKGVASPQGRSSQSGVCSPKATSPTRSSGSGRSTPSTVSSCSSYNQNMSQVPSPPSYRTVVSMGREKTRAGTSTSPNGHNVSAKEQRDAAATVAAGDIPKSSQISEGTRGEVLNTGTLSSGRPRHIDNKLSPGDTNSGQSTRVVSSSSTNKQNGDTLVRDITGAKATKLAAALGREVQVTEQNRGDKNIIHTATRVVNGGRSARHSQAENPTQSAPSVSPYTHNINVISTSALQDISKEQKGVRNTSPSVQAKQGRVSEEGNKTTGGKGQEAISARSGIKVDTMTTRRRPPPPEPPVTYENCDPTLPSPPRTPPPIPPHVAYTGIDSHANMLPVMVHITPGTGHSDLSYPSSMNHTQAGNGYSTGTGFDNPPYTGASSDISDSLDSDGSSLNLDSGSGYGYKFHMDQQILETSSRENGLGLPEMGTSPGNTQHPFLVGQRDIMNPTEASPKIVSSKGTVRGLKNLVKAGIATFAEKHEGIKNYRHMEAGRVVVYMTSCKVIRETYDRCVMMKKILQTHMIKHEERDIFISRDHQKELIERLGDSKDVPQIFADGQYIGSLEELEALNESGEMRSVFKPFKRVSRHASCSNCGGYQYIPCTVCHGSKKSQNRNYFMDEFYALRCTNCDENGLVKCEMCTHGEVIAS